MMNCPGCKSEDTQSVRMAVAAGTTKGSSTGLAVGVGGGLAVGQSTSAHQTELAKSLSPGPIPTMGFIGGLGWGIVALGALFAIIGLASDGQFGCGVGIALFGGLMAWSGGAELSNQKKKWSIRHATAEKSWVCLRCGKVWEPDHQTL